jgi:hypothetical protein
MQNSIPRFAMCEQLIGIRLVAARTIANASHRSHSRFFPKQMKTPCGMRATTALQILSLPLLPP